MANHKSSKKRIRSTETKRVHNKYFAKTTRNTLKKLRTSESSEEVVALLPIVEGMLDKLAKKNIIHKNKAANLKSKAAKRANLLKAA